jgi:hypothetical protein
VRFKQVVEELHVQLVVFHDQDGLRHSIPPSSSTRAAVARPRSAQAAR